ncbi:carboxypeptidase-like regulatory domain-containing protein [Bacteroides sp. 519]|uniref:carboxypeptidase-like regulatory domain-containing protein n=1 Tax=Bacteroides sp. 519 TaxID=2302937 RepID=UPI0013D66F14|nr:carboxypeptidase-like regulatory domain-containing protein [Bacteroides sp. 519]
MNIINYIQGNKKGKNANRFEFDAMNDPFLADALEGYEQEKGKYKNQIENLQKQVMKKCHKGVNYKLIGSIAAVIIVVLTASTYFLIIKPDAFSNLMASFKTEKTKEDTIAQSASNSFTASEAFAETANEDIEEEKPTALQKETRIPVSSETESMQRQPENPVINETVAEPKIVVEQKKVVADSNIAQIQSEPEPIIETPVIQTKVQEVQETEDAERKEESNLPKIRGRVVDKDGNPISGATISIPGANKRTHSNANGYFELEAGDNTNLMIRSLGYDPVTVTGNTTQSIQIVMESL